MPSSFWSQCSTTWKVWYYFLMLALCYLVIYSCQISVLRPICYWDGVPSIPLASYFSIEYKQQQHIPCNLTGCIFSIKYTNKNFLLSCPAGWIGNDSISPIIGEHDPYYHVSARVSLIFQFYHSLCNGLPFVRCTI